MRSLIPLIVLAGCGGGGNKGGDGDASVGGDGSAASDASAPSFFGSVFIQSYTAKTEQGAAVQGGSASATFVMSSGLCARTFMGPCEVDSCTGAAQTNVSAGAITIGGATKPVSLTPAADHTYMAQSSTTALFGPGDMLTAVAAGADVPAFSRSVVAPSKVTITAPAQPSAVTLTVNRASDLMVAWTGGGMGQVLVALLPGGASGTSVYCRFSSMTGQGIVPGQVLQRLQGGSGAFAMAAIDDAETDAGMWSVQVEAYVNAVWPDDTIVSGPTLVQ